MKTILLTIVFVLSTSVALSCGVVPVAPVMPVGCTTQWAVCIDGQWVWVCS